MKIRFPDYILTDTELGSFDSTDELAKRGINLKFELNDDILGIDLLSESVGILRVTLVWKVDIPDGMKVTGGAWERTYKDSEWRSIDRSVSMPWYMLISNGSDTIPDARERLTLGFGVGVRPDAMCRWETDGRCVKLLLDVRSGAAPVYLNGSKIRVADVIIREYENMLAFDAAKIFFSELSPNPLLPSHPVYGSNNWYYAYGKSSHGEIISDAKFVKKMCEDCENIPYMVIDDGWQPNGCDAPWDRGNERFHDMKALADEMKRIGVRPGIWVRYLINGNNGSERKINTFPEEMYLKRCKNVLDPSHPKTLEYVKNITKRLTHDWGYELIKHDFSTFDIFGKWGFETDGDMAEGSWSFYDKSKTTAAVIKELYRTILDSSYGAVIIGCNAINHLCAGLHHLNRTGDDTSGFEWERTRDYGVNTLAFCLAQNRSYYMTDADCVGITGKIDWRLNRMWLKALALSGSPLFVSCKPGVLTAEEAAELSHYFMIASKQSDDMRPIDWMENKIPNRFLINGKEEYFSWE